LQSTSRADAVLALGQEPVEEGVQNVDRDRFEGDQRVFLGELAVSGGVD